MGTTPQGVDFFPKSRVLTTLSIFSHFYAIPATHFKIISDLVRLNAVKDQTKCIRNQNISPDRKIGWDQSRCILDQVIGSDQTKFIPDQTQFCLITPKVEKQDHCFGLEQMLTCLGPTTGPVPIKFLKIPEIHLDCLMIPDNLRKPKYRLLPWLHLGSCGRHV